MKGKMMNSKRLVYLRPVALIVALIVMLLAIAAPVVLAQSAGTAGLTGTVTDPSGAAVPNVTVTLTSNDTNQARTATTGGDGQYKFTLLPPGSYKVRFTANGFKTAEISAVTMSVTESSTLDRKLEVGGQSESVTVEASAETLQTASSTLGTTVGAKAVTDSAALQPQLHADHRPIVRHQRPREQRDVLRQRHRRYQRQRQHSRTEQLSDGRRRHPEHGRQRQRQ